MYIFLKVFEIILVLLELNMNGYLFLLLKSFLILFNIVFDWDCFKSCIFVVVKKKIGVVLCLFVGMVFIVEFSRGLR